MNARAATSARTTEPDPAGRPWHVSLDPERTSDSRASTPSLIGGPSGFAWGLWHYGLVLLTLIAVAVPGAVWLERQLWADSQYTATALVVANSLEIRPEELPRFGISVFEGGSVARAVARGDNSDADYRLLIPDTVSVEPVQQSIAFRVLGRADDPAQSAALANIAAAAFVEQLNKVGEGVGAFSQQDTAYPPLHPARRGPGAVTAAGIGATAGALGGLVLLWVLLALRRPVLTAEAAARLVGAPLIAELALPALGSRRRRGRTASARALLLALAALKQDCVVLAGTPDSARHRRACIDELDAIQRAATADDGRDHRTGAGHSRRTWTLPEAVLAEGVELPMSPVPVVLFVRSGAPAASVLAAAADFGPSEVRGTVFLRGGRLLRSPWAPPARLPEMPLPAGASWVP